MADYWRSNDKKYCDFCKCWITDNKPSVDFHEKGRRHKENVQKRLRRIQKESSRNQRETAKTDNVLKQMEHAALAAYNQDMANGADITSGASESKVASGKKLWMEHKSNDGKSYYQNVITNEIEWVTPKEGFTSLNDQKRQTYNTGKRQIKAVQRHNLIQERARAEVQKHHDDEERARLFREKMKERRVEDIPMSTPGPIIPSGKSTPYGQWEVVKQKSPETSFDLQLPQQYDYELPIPVMEEPPPPEPAPIEFKEKVVESLGNTNVSFKKRKVGSSTKRNIRQRIDDD